MFHAQTPLVFVLAMFLAALAPGVGADWVDDLDGMFKQHVSRGSIEGVSLNLVDYDGIRRDPRYGSALKGLSSATSPTERREKVAYWINAYNLLAVKMMIDHPKVASIKDIGSLLNPVWKMEAGKAGGKMRTLNEIEHEILRKMSEPRIHVAIVCASVSCPDLRPEAYRAEKLEQQLIAQSKAFLANTTKGMRVKGDTIEVSSILKWFEADFRKYGGVTGYLSRYGGVDTEGKTIAYLPYNWKKNGKP